MMPQIATLIVARDAVDTVAEAVASALAEPIDELLLVDDCSVDRTVEVARSIEDERVRVLQLQEHRRLGYARARGLSALRSEFCFLLDADDEFLPGRVDRLSEVLSASGADFVADEVELVEGTSGAFIRRLTLPGFLDRPPGLMRLFERNYLPGIGQIAFRTASMRRIGYDAEIHGTEDTDLVLRALAAGARGALVREVGYRMRHFSGSVSRNRERQADQLAKALCKFSRDGVRDLLLAAGASETMASWSVLSFALFKKDVAGAEAELSAIEAMDRDWDAVLEPEGPCPTTERWRLLFYRGTIALLVGRPGAADLEGALAIARWPEALNNLGVARLRSGQSQSAEALFAEALQAKPGYADARENLAQLGTAERITVHPLRREPSRSEY